MTFAVGGIPHPGSRQQTTSIFLPWEPHEQYEKQNDRILKEKLPRSVSAQYATGDQWRNNSTKNEETEPKQRQHPVVDETSAVMEVKSGAVKSNIS